MDRLHKLKKEQSNNQDIDDLCEYQDQYLKLLEEDKTRFLSRVGEASGGQFVVNAKHILTELACATIENIILERFGSKALRIFRVVRNKMQVEESNLQTLVMIPVKETKLLTYSLVENNFLQIQELRKSLAANAVSKSFFMYSVNLPQVARTVIDLCHKAIGNAFSRKNYEAESNSRQLERYERIESIVANLKSQPDFEENENIQLQLQEIEELVRFL